MTTLAYFCNQYAYLDDETNELDGEEHEKVYDKYYELLNVEFPNSSFDISLGFNELKKLDEPFTDLKKIYIMDGRISNNNYYYSDTHPDTIKSLATKLIVRQKDYKPITLRQILNTMIKHRHYRNKSVCEDPHRFLEMFKKTNDPSIFDTFFGS